MTFLKIVLCMLGFCTTLLIAGCEKIEPLTISNKEFSLDLWSDWELKEEQGIDTYVGYYTNGHEKIGFDYGTFVGGNFNAVMGDPGILYFEETTIDGFPAKIVKSEYDEESMLELLIDLGDGFKRVVVYVLNSQNDEKYIAIFKTFRFL